MLKKLLKFLFNIKKERYSKIITILGIKIKCSIKKEYKIIYETLKSYWEYNGANDVLLSKLEFIEKNFYSWQKYDNRIFLIYISCLIETNQIDKAENILKKYVSFFDLTDIYKYLPVANLAKTLGICNEEIIKSSILFKKLETSHENNVFINYIKNKSIAIVGNSPCELGKNKGKEIDSHDIVIRFNTFKEGYENDYGSKTNVLFLGLKSIPHVVHKKRDITVYKGDYWHREIEPSFYNVENLDTKKIDYISFDINKYCYSMFDEQIFIPTTGCYAILWILKEFKNFDNVDFYGFAFLEDNYKSFTHYYGELNQQQTDLLNIHNHKLETEYLKKIITKSKYKNSLKEEDKY